MNDIDINCNADVTAVCALCRPVWRDTAPNRVNTSPAETKRRLGRFSHPFAEIGRRYENKQEKARGCLAFPSQDTADGNADRIRLCRDFGGCRENRPFGVARIKTSQV